MVNSTSNNRLWRVELEMIHSDTAKTGVICFVYLVTTGLRFYYSHHCIYSRSVAKGPWSPGTIIRQPLNAGLKAILEAGMMSAMWDAARSEDIQVWPGEPGVVEGVDLGV